mgnify:CR=1 FL=1
MCDAHLLDHVSELYDSIFCNLGHGHDIGYYVTARYLMQAEATFHLFDQLASYLLSGLRRTRWISQ